LVIPELQTTGADVGMSLVSTKSLSSSSTFVNITSHEP